MARRLSATERRTRDLDDLVFSLDRLTAHLNALRVDPNCELGGAVRWMIPRVAEERGRVADVVDGLRVRAATRGRRA